MLLANYVLWYYYVNFVLTATVGLVIAKNSVSFSYNFTDLLSVIVYFLKVFLVPYQTKAKAKAQIISTDDKDAMNNRILYCVLLVQTFNYNSFILKYNFSGLFSNSKFSS